MRKMRSKRKPKAEAIEGMAKMLLYADCKHHISGTMPLNPINKATLDALNMTPEQFIEHTQSGFGAGDHARLMSWIESETAIYKTSPNAVTADLLRKHLIAADIEPDEYFRKHFPKIIIDFGEAAKAKKKR